MTDSIPDSGKGRNIRNGLLLLGFALFSTAAIGVWIAVFGKVLSFALSLMPGFPALDFLGKSDAEDALRAVWYATPLTAAYIAALIGYHKFGLFREGKPHLTIDLSASSRSVSTEHNHIGVIARIHNASKVAVPVVNVEWELAVVAPYSVRDILEMEEEIVTFDRESGDVDGDEFPWRRLNEPVALQYDMLVEPNEIEQLTFDFVVPRSIEAVAISLFVENLSSNDEADELGWHRRLFYDIRLA